ncbi:MAG TPA: hypothetical protein VFD04_19720 [Actinomycetes bacterium]|nr:hypothetical protein [Actinomycetes bacterium]
MRRRALLDGWRGLGQADPGVATLTAARAHRLLQLGLVQQAFTMAKRVLLLAALAWLLLVRAGGRPPAAFLALPLLFAAAYLAHLAWGWWLGGTVRANLAVAERAGGALPAWAPRLAVPLPDGRLALHGVEAAVALTLGSAALLALALWTVPLAPRSAGGETLALLPALLGFAGLLWRDRLARRPAAVLGPEGIVWARPPLALGWEELAAVEARQAGRPLGAEATITFLPRDPRQAPLGLRVRGPVGDLDAAVRRLGGVPFRDLRGRP